LRGELASYAARELEVIAYMLMAVRFYLYLRFVKGDGGDGGRLPEWVTRTYMKFLRGGLMQDSVPSQPRRVGSKASKKIG